MCREQNGRVQINGEIAMLAVHPPVLTTKP